MQDFTPLGAAIGGALIGLSAALLLALNGRIAGVSGIVGALLPPQRGDVLWRVLFVLGLVLGAWLFVAAGGSVRGYRVEAPPLLVAVAGVLVGFGTRLGSGCTSGHGICGIARLSPRSLVAVAVFMLSAMLTVFLVRHVLGGGA
jgi:uncharacterized membrane protein YedE/YeeE